MSVYGKDFARVYDQGWEQWTTGRAWPFLWRQVTKHVSNVRTWLDLCCGPGRLLRLVCDAGVEAVGLDRSSHQLRHARRNAPRAKRVRADVRRFALGRRFDVVTCTFDSLNYLTRKTDLERAFRNARRHLAAGGAFVFDMNTFEGLEDIWNATTARDTRDATIVVQSSFDARRALGRCVITGFLKQGRLYRKFREEHVERGYRAAEIDASLGRAGFRFRKYDGRDFGRPRKRSPRLMYVCTAPRGA